MKTPLIHDKGSEACGKVAFYTLIDLQDHTVMDPEYFLLLDGNHPSKKDSVVCGSCGFHFPIRYALHGLNNYLTKGKE